MKPFHCSDTKKERKPVRRGCLLMKHLNILTDYLKSKKINDDLLFVVWYFFCILSIFMCVYAGLCVCVYGYLKKCIRTQLPKSC